MRRNLLNVAGRVYLGFMSVLYLFYFMLETFELDADIELGLYWDNEELLYCGGMIAFIIAIIVMFVVNIIDDYKERKLEKLKEKEFKEELKELTGEES